MSQVRRRAMLRERQNLRIGLFAILLSLIALYLAFAGLPFRGGYRVDAIVQNANALKANAPVRIAGVNVGKVKKVERGPGDTARITLGIDNRGLPIHKDATLKIRPRLFLEGNFFVDLKPGSPSAPKLPDHGTIPLSQTEIPVQFDQVLTALSADTRVDLKSVLHEYRTALDDGGAQAIQRAYRPSAPAFKGLAELSQEAQGLTRDDLRQFIDQGERVSAALNRHHQALADLITNFRRTVGALGSQPGNVAATTRGLARLVDEAYPALGDINDSLPALRRFARQLRPLARRAPKTLDLAYPLLQQLNHLVSPTELPPLLKDLRPALGSLSNIEPQLIDLFDKVQPVSECVSRHALPVLNSKLDDNALTTGLTVWQEFIATMPGLASAAQNFDGNGPAVRYLAGGDQDTVSVGQLPGGAKLFASPDSPILGSRPAKPTSKPPYHPEVACSTQKVPNLAARVTPPAKEVRVRSKSMPKADVKTLLATIKRLSRHESLTGHAVDGKALVRAFDKAKETAK